MAETDAQGFFIIRGLQKGQNYQLIARGRDGLEVWKQWRSDRTYRPPGGETFEEVDERVWAACADLVDDAADGDVVVVSHVSPIKAAVAWALGVDGSIAWRMHLDVASICRVSASPRGATLRSFNETAHLASL